MVSRNSMTTYTIYSPSNVKCSFLKKKVWKVINNEHTQLNYVKILEANSIALTSTNNKGITLHPLHGVFTAIHRVTLLRGLLCKYYITSITWGFRSHTPCNAATRASLQVSTCLFIVQDEPKH